MKSTLGAVIAVGVALALGPGVAPSAIAPSRCGVSQVRHVPHIGWMVVGDGPVSLGLVGGQRRARISIAQSVRDKQGWRAQKTPWLVRRAYRGPVTVTARRIDGPGQVRLAKVYGQHLRRLAFARDNVSPPTHGFYLLPSGALFRSTGCYAFDVSGRHYFERLIVRVVA